MQIKQISNLFGLYDIEGNDILQDLDFTNEVDKYLFYL